MKILKLSGDAVKKIVLDSASNGLSFEFFSDRELVILVNDHSLLQKFLYF